eukprot:m.88390 g.88390  ORF g.88390 m.88390 type:complete len:178 (+) comp11639_c0_seq1:133-666(+)
MWGDGKKGSEGVQGRKKQLRERLILDLDSGSCGNGNKLEPETLRPDVSVGSTIGETRFRRTKNLIGFGPHPVETPKFLDSTAEKALLRIVPYGEGCGTGCFQKRRWDKRVAMATSTVWKKSMRDPPVEVRPSLSAEAAGQRRPSTAATRQNSSWTRTHLKVATLGRLLTPPDTIFPL